MKQESIAEWSEWGMKPHSIDEIRTKALSDFDNVCWTYVCSKSCIPEKDVFELAALSTGLLDTENYDEYIDALVLAIKQKLSGHEQDIDWDTLPIPEWYWDEEPQPGWYQVTNAIRLQLLNDRLDWQVLHDEKPYAPGFKYKYRLAYVL